MKWYTNQLLEILHTFCFSYYCLVIKLTPNLKRAIIKDNAKLQVLKKCNRRSSEAKHSSRNQKLPQIWT